MLDYPQIAKRRVYYALSVDDVLQAFDSMAQLFDAAPKASATCKDPDDQKFIDLAAQHRVGGAEFE